MFLADGESRLPPAFIDAVDVPIYLPMPHEYQASLILQHGGIAAPMNLDAAQVLFDQARQKHVRYANESFARAAENTRAEHKRYQRMRAEQVAESLVRYCQAIEETEVRRYEGLLAPFRARAETVIKRWLP